MSETFVQPRDVNPKARCSINFSRVQARFSMKHREPPSEISQIYKLISKALGRSQIFFSDRSTSRFAIACLDARPFYSVAKLDKTVAVQKAHPRVCLVNMQFVSTDFLGGMFSKCCLYR